MRIVALTALLLATAPAAAQTPEQQAAAECIRNLTDHQMIHGGWRKWCRPKQDGPSQDEIFPLQVHWSVAREVVRFRVALRECPLAKAGPGAAGLWRSVLNSYQHTPPNVPAIRAWIDQEVEKESRKRPIYDLAERCERAKGNYGDMGRKSRNAIVMRDGSTTTRKCVLDGSCRTSDSVDVYVY